MTHYLLTKADGHTHSVLLDEQGNGRSTVGVGNRLEEHDHRHDVVNKKVQEANGHTHKLRKQGVQNKAFRKGVSEEVKVGKPPVKKRGARKQAKVGLARGIHKKQQEEAQIQQGRGQVGGNFRNFGSIPTAGHLVAPHPEHPQGGFGREDPRG